ncbi:MAG: hypothetical protein ACE5HS_01385 [bacterium]
MGQRELLLTIGAIVIFALTTLSVNRRNLSNTDAILQRQAEFLAVGVAQRFIEEAKVKAFDENTINGNPISMPSGFTGSPLGPGEGESYPNFDDVDDFNGLTTTVPTNMGPMSVNVEVQYVHETKLDSVVSTKTFNKKMTVTVDCSYLNKPVALTYIFAFLKNP